MAESTYDGKDLKNGVITNSEEFLQDVLISESSIDDALECLPMSKKSMEVSESSSVSCNSSNGSDLMAQLSIINRQLKEEKMRDKQQLNTKCNAGIDPPCIVRNVGVSTGFTANENRFSPTENYQAPGNLCVIQRYGRYDDDDSCTNVELTSEDIRRKIKEDSFQICKNKGVLDDQNAEFSSTERRNQRNSFCSDKLVQHTDDKLSFLQLSNKKDKEKEEKSCVHDSVNEMLNNVNRIINGSTLSETTSEENLNREEKEFYDDTRDLIVDEETEYVQNYTVFNDDVPEKQEIGNSKYITPNLYVSSLKENEQEAPDLDDALLCHKEEDLGARETKVIEWNSILEEEHFKNNPAISPVKTPQKKSNIFDNVFSNSFILDDKTKENQSTNRVDTTPKKDILGMTKRKEKNEEKVKERSSYSESCNRKYVAGLYSNKIHVDSKRTGKVQTNENAVLKEKEEFNKEIAADEKNDLLKLTRQLNFGNEFINANGHTFYSTSRPICLACTFPSSSSETPLKHIDSCPEVSKKVKSTQSVGVSTQDIVLYFDEENDDKQQTETKTKTKSKKKKKKNKKSNGNNEENQQENAEQASNNITISTQSSSSQSEQEEKNILDMDQKSTKKGDVEINKKVAVIQEFLESVSNDGSAILVDETSSFAQPIRSMPDTNRQLLMLKIPLEAPGVCKGSSSESKLAMADSKNSDSFIDLVTFFIMLLKDNRWNIPSFVTNIPFDVVAMQQCILDDELILLVGISENDNAQQYKVKRTKLGSAFFHAVSHFFNNTQISDILRRIWENTVINQQRGDIFQQLEQNEKIKSSFSNKKLSSFVYVIPDSSMLQKVFQQPPSIQPHVFKKNNLSSSSYESLNWFETSLGIPEYTCIHIENILLMQPRYIIEFFRRLRYESVELCGLRIGYPANVSDNQPILAVAICEVDSANVEEGKILLSECNSLRSVPISFQSENHLSVNDEAIIKYSLNKNRAHRNLVQWFGPHFDSVEDFKDSSHYTRLTTNSNNIGKTLKRKAVVDLNCEGIPLLVSSPTYGILLVSAALKSSLLALVISLAGKRGLSLKAYVRNMFSSNQLHGFGLTDSHISDLGRQQNMSPSNNLMSFNVLLFHGCNAISKLVGLTEKLTSIFSSQVTGETLNSWTKDTYFYIDEKSHNATSSSLLRKRTSLQDYFAVLNFIESTYDIFKPQRNALTSKHFPILKYLADSEIANRKPSLNLQLYVIYGHLSVKLIPNLLKKINIKYILSSLNEMHKVFASRTYLNEMPLDLIGLKYLKNLGKSQIQDLLTKEEEGNESLINELENSNIVLLVYQGDNKKTLDLLHDTITHHLSTHIEIESNKLIVHKDQTYILQLLFQYFHPYEIFTSKKPSQYHIPSIYLPEQSQILQSFEKIHSISLLKKCIKKDISKNENMIKALQTFQLNPSSCIYEVPMLDLPYPVQLLFSNSKSYAGYSVNYNPEHAGVIIKVLSRFCRMGFQICALKFPSFDKGTSTCHLRVGLFRENALIVLHKLMFELESSYKMLKYSVTETVNEVRAFFCNEIKDSQGGGGLFQCNYWAAWEELQFVQDDSFDSRHSRAVEWNPQSTNFSYEYDEEIGQSVAVPSSVLLSTTMKTHEVTVVLITEPLISGKYLDKSIPFAANFLEFWMTMEKIGYRAIAMKMTSLNEKDAEEVTSHFNVEAKKKKQMEYLMGSVETPFIVAAFLGSCILSNMWIQLERNVTCSDAICFLKKFTLFATSRSQAEYLLTSFFKQVFANAKVEIQTKME